LTTAGNFLVEDSYLGSLAIDVSVFLIDDILPSSFEEAFLITESFTIVLFCWGF
jgi:hypothetical protein